MIGADGLLGETLTLGSADSTVQQTSARAPIA